MNPRPIRPSPRRRFQSEAELPPSDPRPALRTASLKRATGPGLWRFKRQILCAALVLAGSVPAEAFLRAVVREYEARKAERAHAAHASPAAATATTESISTSRAPATSVGSYNQRASAPVSQSGTASLPAYPRGASFAPALTGRQPAAPATRAATSSAPGFSLNRVGPVTATAYNYTSGFVVDSTDNPGGITGIGAGDTLAVSGGEFVVGNFHTGVFTQSGGTATLASDAPLLIGYHTGSNGTYNLQNGSLVSGSTAYVGYDGTGTFNQTGGTFNVINNHPLILGFNSNANGTYTLSGGTLTTPQTIVSDGSNVSVFTQSGSSIHNVTDLFLSNFTTASDGTYNLDGGSLNTGAVSRGTNTSSRGTGTFNFNGGTLRATRNDNPSSPSTPFVFFGDLTTAQVRDGGAFIDTNGFNVTVSQGLLHSGIGGDATTDGGLTKNGAGTLTLTGVSTYTGNTIVNAGTLAVTAGGLSNTASLQINNNATASLGGTANIPTPVLLVNSGTFNQNGGTFGIANTSVVYVGVSGTGTVNQTGGTFSASGLIVGFGGTAAGGAYNLSGATSLLSTGAVFVGNQAAGFFTQSGGTFTTNGNELDLGYFTGFTGTYTQSGGSLSTGKVGVGIGGTGVFVQSGGMFTTNGNALSVGSATGGFGTYTLSGGALETGSTAITGGSASSSFSQAGGTHLTGGVTIASPGTGSAGVYNLDGGTLSTGSITGGTGTSRLLFNGGIVQPRNSSTNFISGITGANVRNGGAIFDTNGFDVTVPQLLAHSNFEGDNAIDGGLTKNSTGSLTLTANNTYTGRTFVTSGMLYVNNVAAAVGDSGTGAGPVYVGAGAWLGGNGTISGTVYVGANAPMSNAIGQPNLIVSRGTLTPGVNGPGVLTIDASLNLKATAAYEVDLGGLAAGSGYDQTKVGRNIFIDGILTLTLTNSFQPTVGNKFFILDITSGGGVVGGVFANATAGNLITDDAGNTYLINYADNAGDGGEPNDVSLLVVAVAVPEPGTWTMIFGGAGALAWMVRRRLRAA